MQKLSLIAGLGAVAAGLALIGCSQGGGAAPLVAGEAVLKASEWKFAPGAFRVEAGKPIKLVLQNDGKTDHDVKLTGLVVAGKEVQVAARPGEKASIEFTPAQAGVYEMTCTLPGHRESGMVGKVEVVAGS